MPLSRWALQWWSAVVGWLGYPYFRSKQWSTLFWLCLTQFWLKVKCGQERPDTWKQKKYLGKGGTLWECPPPPPCVQTHGSVTTCIYCKLFIERNASKVWGFFDNKLVGLVLFPVCCMVLFTTRCNCYPISAFSLKQLASVQRHFDSSSLSKNSHNFALGFYLFTAKWEKGMVRNNYS